MSMRNRVSGAWVEGVLGVWEEVSREGAGVSKGGVGVASWGGIVGIYMYVYWWCNT